MKRRGGAQEVTVVQLYRSVKARNSSRVKFEHFCTRWPLLFASSGLRAGVG